jgi:predicted MFS family arabinose efflux permease
VLDEEDRSTYEGWRVAVASSACVFVSFASLLVYTFGVFLKPLAEEFSWSREAVSAAFGIAAMTVALVSPLLGFLLDRLHPARVIVPCMITFGVAFASLAVLTPHLGHLYAVFLFLGWSRTVPRRWRTRAPYRAGSCAGAAPRWPWSCLGEPSARSRCRRSPVH